MGLNWLIFIGGFRRPSSFAAAGPGCNREPGTPPFESAFVCGKAQVVQRKTAGGHMGPPLRGIWKRALLFRRGRTLAGPSRGFCHSEAHPHPPRMRSAPSPLQGEGYFAPGALAQKTQAQCENRTRNKFCTPRAQWPGRKRGQALLVLRAGNEEQPLRSASPVMGVRGRLPLSGGDGPKCQRG